MKESISIIQKEDCTGCGACYNRCPLNAINMEENSEGFEYPIINDKCSHCGLCLSVCPIANPVQFNNNPIAYAVRASDTIREKSSSGGMFALLCKYVFDNNGIVYGAAFTDDFLEVNHIYAESDPNCFKIRGSKYLQSKIGLIFRDIERSLKDDRFVLFTGTPCQVAGIKTFLNREYHNLITADIVCHGVPSPAVYRAYVKEICQGKRIIKVDFREKAYWGWGTATSIFLEDGSVYRNNCYKDYYWNGFLKGIITRKNCGKCKYARATRVGDFTLGDFWGCGKIDKSLDDKKGTSLVLLNSDKSKEIFKQINNYCDAKPINLSEVLEIAKTHNGQLLHPTPNNKYREKFFSIFNGSSFTKPYESALGMENQVGNKLYDIGYVGWWDSTNYGSSLTCFAMNRTLKQMGKTVLMLAHPAIDPEKDYSKSYGMQFAKQFYDCSDLAQSKNPKSYNKQCNTFIVGSDQLWAGWNQKTVQSRFFILDFVDKGHKKIAYATSFGGDCSLYPEWNRFAAGYFMSRFDAISVREKSGVEICKRDFSVNATWVMDPVFLCGKDAYNEIIQISKVNVDYPYIFAYILDPTEEKIQSIYEIAKYKKIPYRLVVDGQNKNLMSLPYLKNDTNLIKNPRIEDWLAYLKNSAFVVSDSFHAFCFSMIFNKNMVAYVNERRGKARFDSISAIAGLQSRVLNSVDKIQIRHLLDSDIDFNVVEKNLNKHILQSKAWLINALNSKILGPNVDELMRWRIISLTKEVSELKKIVATLNENNKK